MGKKFVEDEAKFAKSGFADLKKVRGLVVDIDTKAPPAEWETDKYNLVVYLDDAVGLETFSGDDPMDFKDNKYSLNYPYAEPKGDGSDELKNPPESGVYKKVLWASCKAQGIKPSDMIGTVRTFERLPITLFQHRPKKDDNGKPIEKGEDGMYPLVDVVVTNYFSLVPDEGSDNENTKQFAQDMLVGLGEKATRRKLVTETRFKQFPELKDKLNEGLGVLADYLGMVVDDDEKLAMPAEKPKAEKKESIKKSKKASKK